MRNNEKNKKEEVNKSERKLIKPIETKNIKKKTDKLET